MNLQNLIDYCEWQGIDVFENCSVPAPININMVKSEIIKRCGLLTPVYSEPLVFKELVKMWFDSNQYNFDHLVKIINANYSPIENVYESDHWSEKHSGKDTSKDSGSTTDTLSGSDTDTLSGSDTDTLSGTDTDTLSGSDSVQGSGSDTLTHGATTTHSVSAFNSAGYQADSQDATTGDDVTKYGKKDTTTYGKIDTVAYGKVDTMAYGKVDTMAYGKIDTIQHGKQNDFTHGHNITYDRLRHGNIGVTTNNRLETEEIEWLDRFNPYDWIAAKFERENFVLIY